MVSLTDSNFSGGDFDRHITLLWSQNDKPKWQDAPDWANWLAQDADGRWYWFENPPLIIDDHIYQEWVKPSGKHQYTYQQSKVFNWKLALEERPSNMKPKSNNNVENCGPAEVKDLRGKVSIDGAYDNEPNTTVFQGMPILGHNYKNPNPLDNIQIDPVYVSQDQEFDEVENPSHYKEGRQFEVIEVLEDNICRAPDPVKGSHQWQVLRYGMRLWDKDTPLKNARKAKWYLNRLIDQLEEDEFNDNS
mgnify:CR=1 FL=1